MAEVDTKTEARWRFTRLQKKASQLGLTNNDILTLGIIQEHQKPINASKFLYKVVLFLFIVAGLVLTLGYGGYYYGLVTPRWLAEKWAKHVFPMDLESEQCLMPTTEIMLDMFRPPLDCSFCQGIAKEDRVANLTAEEFKSKHAYSGKVTVVTDGTKDWTASKFFSLPFFKGVYGKDSPVLSSTGKECQFFRYNTNFESLKEVFTMPKKMQRMEGQAWYVGWSNCDPKAASTLRKYYNRPYFFSDEIESSKTDWIFMGTPGYGAHMHIDNVRYPSWQAQIQGTKIWTIQPPPECYYKCPGEFKVVVNPGDIIILDTNKWFHQTDIVGQNMSITIGSEYD